MLYWQGYRIVRKEELEPKATTKDKATAEVTQEKVNSEEKAKK